MLQALKRAVSERWPTLQVVTEPEGLSPSDVVALSSFGFGGTNVHVVLRGPPAPPAPPLQATGDFLRNTHCSACMPCSACTSIATLTSAPSPTWV